jgi:membrane fusion protein, hemolysin D
MNEKAVSEPMTLRVASALFEIEAGEPTRTSRIVLWTVCVLMAVLIVWATFAQLDIVAVASGRLVPQTYVKVVQPAEAGIIREILVEEGDRVEAGQVLVRLDPTVNAVDSAAVERELAIARLQLRRIESELAGAGSMARQAEDALELFAQVEAQRQSHRQQFLDATAQERAAQDGARSELAAARELLKKLEATLPSYVQSAEAYEKLAKQKLVGELEAIERRRAAIEAAQDLEAQRASVVALEASIAQHEQSLAQLRSAYASELNQSRLETVASMNRLEQQLGRLEYQQTLLELKAPQEGVVKELATTTVGAVVQPGTVIVTLVPQDEPLWAEVAIENKDIGFVALDQPVRVKLLAYEFQKYGMLDGIVRNVSADSAADGGDSNRQPGSPVFKALIELGSQELPASGLRLPLAAGMQVSAEIMQGRRTVLEYLLSPVQRVTSEAGLER